MKHNVMKTTPQIIRENLCTVFNGLNLLIALSLAAVGAWKNILFMLVIVVNTAVGIVQEIKAKQQIEKLTLLAQPKVTVIRHGEMTEVAPEQLLGGETVRLEAGCAVCCDCVVSSGTVEVDKSVLTEESEPVVKSTGEMLLAGCEIISGKCLAEVTHSCEDSFISKIVDEVKRTQQKKSEMLTAMKKVTRVTDYFIVPLGALLLLQGSLFRGVPLMEGIVSTSAGLLGMLPKGLVLLISIGFAAGVIRLSKKQVLVRELYSLENLAHCDTVCLDKTGTLTEGRLSVEQVEVKGDTGVFWQLMATYCRHTEDNNATCRALKEYFPETGASTLISLSFPFGLL